MVLVSYYIVLDLSMLSTCQLISFPLTLVQRCWASKMLKLLTYICVLPLLIPYVRTLENGQNLGVTV